MDDPNHSMLYEHGVIAHNLYTGHGFSMHWPYESFDTARAAAMKQPPKWEGAFLAPLNPYLLFLSYKVFGESTAALYAMMIFYAIVTSFIPLVVFKLAMLLGKEMNARISSILAAIYLPGAYAVATYSGSALFQFMGVVILYFAVRSAIKPSWESFLWLGISCGIMTGLRSEFFFLGPIMIAVSLFIAAIKNDRIAVITQGLASIAVCLAIIAPWTVRNYELYNKFVPVVSHPWWELWRGNNLLTAGTNRRENGEAIWVNPTEFPTLVRRIDSIPYDKNFEGKVDQIFHSEVINFVETHPAKFLSLALKKIFYLFTRDPNDRLSGNAIYLLSTILTSLLIIVGIVQLIRNRKKWEASIPIVIFLGYYLFMTAVTLMQTRYQIYVFTCMLPVTGLAFFPSKQSDKLIQ